MRPLCKLTYRSNRDWEEQADYERWRAHGHERGWFDHVRDDIESWMGNEDARRRLQFDRRRRHHSQWQPPNPLERSFSGFAGPEYGYSPSERLTAHGQIDARDIDVTVQDQTVVLNGTVPDYFQKRLVTDLCEDIWGVTDVQNNLRIQTPAGHGAGQEPTSRGR